MVAAHGGQVVDTAGDAFFVAFGGAKQAVLCALEVQRALAAHDWPAAGRPGRRVNRAGGPGRGRVHGAGGAPGGADLRRGRRGPGAGLAGDAGLMEDEEEEEELGFSLVDVGERAVKDLDRPVRLFQLAGRGLDPLAPSAGGRLIPGLPQGWPPLSRSGRRRGAGGLGRGARVPGGADQFHRPGRAGA